MKHRLAPFLEGMEMGKSEHDWLEQRLESMTAKEELLFRGAMQIESPRDIQTTIKILQGLDHYQLLYGAEDDVLLGRFVMEHIHTPTHAARGYLDPEIVGAAYREHGSGSFVENHYVERLNPDRPLPEVNPNVPLPILTIAGLTMLVSLGDMMPPTAMAGTFAAEVTPGVDKYNVVLKRCIVPMAFIMVWGLVFIIFSNQIAAFIG